MQVASGTRYYVGPVDAPQRYSLNELKSRGGEGELWLGTVEVGGRDLPVAVKMSHDLPDNQFDSAAAKLLQQAELLRFIDHPNIVKVREAFVGVNPETGHRALYLAMNYVPGADLVTWAQQHLDRSVNESVQIVDQIAAALDYLHRGEATGGAPVLHRDVKPANVIVGPDGSVRLVDFGVASFADNAVTVVGTPRYMAPEVVAGNSPNVNADRYGLGAIAYFLFTGKAPNPFDPAGSRARLLTTKGIADPIGFANHIMEMLATDPASRPVDIAAWAKELDRKVDATGVSESVLAAQESVNIPPVGAASSIAAPNCANGHPLEAGQRFCTVCGRPAKDEAQFSPITDYAPPAIDTPVIPTAMPKSRTGLGVGVALAIVALAIGAYLTDGFGFREQTVAAETQSEVTTPNINAEEEADAPTPTVTEPVLFPDGDWAAGLAKFNDSNRWYGGVFDDDYVLASSGLFHADASARPVNWFPGGAIDQFETVEWVSGYCGALLVQGALPGDGGTYVTRINPATGEELWRLSTIPGATGYCSKDGYLAEMRGEHRGSGTLHSVATGTPVRDFANWDDISADFGFDLTIEDRNGWLRTDYYNYCGPDRCLRVATDTNQLLLLDADGNTLDAWGLDDLGIGVFSDFFASTEGVFIRYPASQYEHNGPNNETRLDHLVFIPNNLLHL